MGLEAVEIVMQVEEGFGIAIKDSDAEKMVTPHDLIEQIMNQAGRTGRVPCLKQRAFHRIRASLMRRFGLKREQIRLETRLTEVVPRPARKNHFDEILKELGINKSIELVRPDWMTQMIAITVMASSLALTVFFAFQPVPYPILSYIINVPVLAVVFFVVLFGWLAAILTRGQRYEFEPAMATVEGLSRWMVANSSNLAEAPPGQWSREQVAEKVRSIVIDVLGCEKEYREDAEFVKDLGVG